MEKDIYRNAEHVTGEFYIRPMTNFMMSDPAATSFVKGLSAVIVFDSYTDEFNSLVRFASGSKEIEEGVANIARKIAEERGLTATTETTNAIAYHFVLHAAEMSILTRED